MNKTTPDQICPPPVEPKNIQNDESEQPQQVVTPEQGKTGFFIKFMKLAGPFWRSEHKVLILRRTLSLLVLTVLQIVIAVIITEWSAALFDALEQHNMSGLLIQIDHLALIFAGSMIVIVLHLKVKRDIQISWRAWLTANVIGRWMNKGHHYQIAQILTVGHDNPDGRIAEDIRIATDEAVNLCYTLIYSLLLLGSFTEILWTLSGVVRLDLGEFQLPIYGHLVWLALLYAFFASVLGWWAGRPLTLTTNAMQTVEANFRFGLVKARENAQAISQHHGEAREQKRFLNLFQDINGIYDLQTRAWEHIILFSSGYAVLSMALPILITAPRYISGIITLGALMQSVQAFQQMAAALSWPANNMPIIAQWHASVDPKKIS
jgi:putative ATP-binding cassette transporter